MKSSPWTDIGDRLGAADRIEWLVADLSLARALFGGVPVARLLARTRLASDEADMSAAPLESQPQSRWDMLLKGLFARAPSDLERVKRQVARHSRASSDEGPLPAHAGVVAVLALACAASADPDASIAEAVAEAGASLSKVPPELVAAVAAFDPRLARAGADPRAPLYEACVRLATRASAGPWPVERLAEASRQLASAGLGPGLARHSDEALYPRDTEPEIREADRRMLRIQRAELDALVARDARELAAVIARSAPAEGRDSHLDSLLAELARLLVHPGALLVAAPLLDVEADALVPQVPSSRSPSWVPLDWSSEEAGAALADALERGATTPPRVRAAVARGGEAALDTIGAEMLRAFSHPFASATFAEILARSSRTRDVVRLLTYFAVAPDPAPAARSLSLCASPDMPGLLTAWLEAMLPHDGAQAPDGEDPVTSSGARLKACIASLAPYPQLYRVVRPLLSRVSEAPPPA